MLAKHQHICPRNCYDTCSLISTTCNGVLISVEGSPAHDYTKGKLCPKAMSDIQKVYSPSRIRYPMRQRHRFSGDWERITWDEALEQIARTILRLKSTHGSTLPLALNKYSGNFGALHNAMEALFSGIGPTTRAIGSPCWSAGVDAQTIDFGRFRCSSPLDMANAKLIWLWGVNPAWTAIHQIPIIFDAMERGTTVVCFDTHLSATAARSHRFIQVRPGTDGLLALAMGKVLAEENLLDPDLPNYTLGYHDFLAYLDSEIRVERAATITGVEADTIRDLAREYGQTHPACIWAGFGLQRYTNGGQTLRAIDALGALAGHIGEKGGGVQYGHFETWKFSGLGHTEPSQAKANPVVGKNPSDRALNINKFAAAALACTEPPVRMLWLAGRNPLSQDADLHLWQKLMNQLELIVVSDLFLTRSAAAADIFLPVTTHYEHWDLHASYWHYWVGVNEPAIAPVGESKSDLEIAWRVSAKLNELEPGSCTFPTSGSEKETLLRELSPELLRLLRLQSPKEILLQPVKANLPPASWAQRQFATPSGRFEFRSEKAVQAGFPALPSYSPPLSPPPEAPLRLLTPHHSSALNSQSYPPDTLPNGYTLYVNPELAESYGLNEGAPAEIANDLGAVPVRLAFDLSIPRDVVIVYQHPAELKDSCLNVLLRTHTTDMGTIATGAPGLALNETFVCLRRLTGSVQRLSPNP